MKNPYQHIKDNPKQYKRFFGIDDTELFKLIDIMVRYRGVIEANAQRSAIRANQKPETTQIR